MKKLLKNINILILPFLLIFSLGFNVFQYFNNQKTLIKIPKNIVASVVDGDTFVLENGQRIRLSNVYAPELKYCGGNEAKEFIEKLILGKNVVIETSSEDVYNRTLALVYFGDTLVNEALLKKGLVLYDGSPNSKRDILKAAYDFAVENKLGIHGPPCRSEKPDKPNCLIKGNIARSNGQKNYFFLGCSEYNAAIVEKNLGEEWFCTEKEAVAAGFKKGTNCPSKYN